MTIDKEKLRAQAEAATQDHGARRVEVDLNGRNVIGDGSWKIFIAWHTPDGKGKENADFCAAASPSTILALLGEIERLQADLAEMTGYRDNAANHMRRIRAESTDAENERDQLKAENETLRKHAPHPEIIWCECGDGHHSNSYGAGFMAANGGVCENCDAAQPKVSCPLELFESLRDSASEEASQHRQCMGSYRPRRQELLDAVVRQCDELIAGVSKEASHD